MPKIITHGATLHCTLGVKNSKLTVTSQTFRRIADTLVGTEADKDGMVNIPSFSICKYCCPIKPLYTAISSLNPAEIGMISSNFKFQAPH